MLQTRGSCHIPYYTALKKPSNFQESPCEAGVIRDKNIWDLRCGARNVMYIPCEHAIFRWLSKWKIDQNASGHTAVAFFAWQIKSRVFLRREGYVAYIQLGPSTSIYYMVAYINRATFRMMLRYKKSTAYSIAHTPQGTKYIYCLVERDAFQCGDRCFMFASHTIYCTEDPC